MPEPPPAFAVAAAAPEAQAAQLADALAQPDQRLAAWLGVYKALGIPVIDTDGKAVSGTGDDPVGPRYWMVWNGAATDNINAGVTLADAGRILTLGPDGSSVDGAGAALLADLRAAAASSDPGVRLLGDFARERILRGPSKTDLLSPDATPDSLIIDTSTIQLLEWVVIRGEMVSLAQSGTLSSAAAPEHSFASVQVAQESGGGNCSGMFGDEDVNFWTKSVKQVFGEKALPGIVGLNEKQGLAEHGGSASAQEMASTYTGRINAGSAALGFAAMMNAISAEGDMNGPLERTKDDKYDGQENTIHWKLFFEREKGAYGSDGWACTVNFISSVTGGAKLELPESGPIEGAEMTFQGGKNIPEKVFFNGDQVSQKVETKSGGMADLPVIGRHQKKKMPDDAKPYDDTFTVVAEAQPEAESAKSIFGTFIDSYLAWSGEGGAAFVEPVVDMLKTVHWSLGEYEFLLTDWKQKGFKVAESQGEWTFTGTICDTSQPFRIDGTGPESTQHFDFNPIDESKGNVNIGGILAGEIVLSGSGQYVIEGLDEGKPKLRIVHQESGSLGGISASNGATGEFDLIPLDTDECK